MNRLVKLSAGCRGYGHGETAELAAANLLSYFNLILKEDMKREKNEIPGMVDGIGVIYTESEEGDLPHDQLK